MKIKNATKQGYIEAEIGDGIDISGRMQYHRGTVQKGISQTLTTMGGNDVGVVIKNYSQSSLEHIERNIVKGETANCITAHAGDFTGNGANLINTNLKIRKLTPCECIKLMGFEKCDFDAMRQLGLSDAAIYHVAGDSIVVPVLMSIFANFVNEENDKHTDIINNYVDNIKNNGMIIANK